MNRVELMHEVELAALFFLREVIVVDVLDHLLHGVRLGVDARTLKHAGEER